ncbi:MAG: hypothetical protein ACKVQS_04155 [Fimbriimonadaceae bacterium]
MIAALFASYTFSQVVVLKGTPRTPAEHDAIYSKTTFPYIVEIETRAGHLLFLGTEHIYDPQNPQFGKIEESWQSFKPDIALIESRNLASSSSLNEAAKRGEPAFVATLAKQNGIKVSSLEPEPKVEGAALVAAETPERAHLFLTLRNYFSRRRTQPEIPDTTIQLALALRASEYGLTTKLKTVADLDALWKADFPELPNWRNARENVLSGKGSTYLNHLANVSNQIRDDHWAKTIVSFVRQGKKVFVVGGASHAINLEPVLRATLAEEVR